MNCYIKTYATKILLVQRMQLMMLIFVKENVSKPVFQVFQDATFLKCCSTRFFSIVNPFELIENKVSTYANRNISNIANIFC